MKALPTYMLDSSHGLGSNQIHRLAQDSHGRLWMATPVGLACFDGSFAHHWDRRNGLRCNGLRSVAADSEDRVWIGTDLGLELLDREGRAAPTLCMSEWPFGLCQCIAPGAGGTWAGTAKGLVKLEENPDRTGFEVAFDADVGFVSSIAHMGSQRVLAASARAGLVETNGHTWWPYRCEALRGRQITCVARGHGSDLLVGGDDGLYVIDDARSSLRARLDIPGIDAHVSALAVAGDRYWVALGRHLYAVRCDTPELHILEAFWVESPINDILLDALGNVFLATNNSGLAKVSCLRHAIERIDLGHPGGVFTIRAEQDDCYAIGGEQLFGTGELANDARPVPLAAPAGLPETIVWDSLRDATGTWVASQAGVYHAGNGAEFRQCFEADPVLGAPARVLLNHDDALWIGSLRGLARLHAGTPEYIEGLGRPLGYVYALSADASGALWIGTLGRGLWRMQKGLHAHHQAPFSASGNTYAIAPGRDGRTLVIQDDLVVMLEPDLSARVIASLPPVAGWTICWIDQRTAAIGASDGLRIIELEQGNILHKVQSHLRPRDWEFTNNRALTRDRQGRFLCGLSCGLVRVDLEALRRYTAPSCRLVDIVWEHQQPELHGETWRIRPGRWSFELRAASAWFVEAASVRYQFQLVGFDEDWQAARELPKIKYTTLPPGRYRLLCRAYSPLAGTGPASELLRLHVWRPLWTIGWTAALAALDSFYQRMVLARTRNRNLLQDNRQLEQAVAERTESLREANRQLEQVRDAYKRLSEIDELTQLGNRRNFDRELGRALALSRRLGTPLALLMIDIDHFKSVNDLLGHPVGDDYLRRVGKVLASSIRHGEDIATRFGGEEFALLLLSTDEAEARMGAERIRGDVERLGLRNEGAPNHTLTISIGIAVKASTRELDANTLIELADRALYRAKRAGRNRVEVARPA